MTVIDFIDINDDIIELSSDEETVQEDHTATQCRATLLDRQAVFVLAGEGMQDGQAAFVSAVEGSQAATESGNSLVATTSPSVTEKTPLHTAESQNCANSPTAPFPSPTSTTPKVLSSEVGDTKQAVFFLAGEGRQDAQAAFVSAVEGSQMATESGNILVATASPSVTEKTPLHTAESQNCASSPTAPFPSPTSTSPKVLSSEVGDTKQDVFVLAGEGWQDGQAAFVSAVEGSQAATESGNALVATTLPSVTEKIPLHTAESQNCASSPTAPFPSPTSTTAKVLSSEVGDTKQDVFVLASEGRQDGQAAFVSAVEGSQVATESGNSLVDTTLPSVTEKTPLHTAESQNCASSPTAPFPSPTSTTPKFLSSEVGDTKQDMFVLPGEGRQDGQAAFDSAGEGSQKATESGNALVATASPSIMENVPLDMADSKNCPSSPTSAPLPSPVTTTPKDLTSEDGDTKPVRVKRPKKYYTRTPRRSPRFEQKRECCDDPVEQPASHYKRSRLLESAEESAAPADYAESTKTLSTDSEKTPLHRAESQNCASSPTAPFPSPTSTTPKVLSSEVGDTKQDMFVLAGEGRQDGQAAFDSAGEGSQKATEFGNALVATASPSIMKNVPLDMADSKNCPSSPISAPLPSPATTTPKALTSEDGDTKPARVKRPKKNYTRTPRRSPRFEQKRECCDDPVEQPAAHYKWSRLLESAEESAAPADDAESTKTRSTDAEKTPLHTAESQNCASSPTAPFPSLTCTTPKVLSSEVCDTEQDVFVLAGEGRQDGLAAFDLAGEGSQAANESGDALVATASPSVTEKTPLDMADSKNCPSSPTSAPVPSPATTAPKALTSEDSDTKPARAKHHKKYYTHTPRRSPRFEQKGECCDDPVEQPADGHKRPCLLQPAEESAAPDDDAESAKALSD